MKSNKFILVLLLLNLCVSYIHAEVLLFSKAYELALKNTNSLKSNVYVSRAEKERITQEESKLYPQINLSGYYKKSEYVYGDPERDKINQGLLNYSLSVNQAVYNAETYSRITAQELRSEFSQSGVELGKEQLAQRVFDAYLNILKSRNKIKLFEAHLEYKKVKLQELTKKYKMNLANKMDLLQMRVEYNSVNISLNKEKKLFDLHTLKLQQFIGDIEYELPDIDLEKSILDMTKSMKEAIVNNNVSLKIQQAQISLKLSDAELETAQDAHLPKVSLDASYAKYDTDDPTVEAPYETSSYIMLNVKVPIYSGGYTSSNVASKKLLYRASLEDLIQVKKDVKVEYNEYLAYFEASVESVTLYKDALRSAELFTESIKQGYSYGLKSSIDLHDAKVKLYDVKYKYIENIYEMVNSYIGLLIVTNNFDNIELLDTLVQ